MRRRIERSRARCEKAAATSHKTDKLQEAKAHPNERTQAAQSES
jgi:hypothetical protein